jgi:hypothetical protein
VRPDHKDSMLNVERGASLSTARFACRPLPRGGDGAPRCGCLERAERRRQPPHSKAANQAVRGPPGPLRSGRSGEAAGTAGRAGRGFRGAFAGSGKGGKELLDPATTSRALDSVLGVVDAPKLLETFAAIAASVLVYRHDVQSFWMESGFADRGFVGSAQGFPPPAGSGAAQVGTPRRGRMICWSRIQTKRNAPAHRRSLFILQLHGAARLPGIEGSISCITG